jgi:tetratricopeptide (TPR) repeat protein
MTDSKRLEKAQYYLKEAAVPSVESLAPRTQCIYYYTESDLYSNEGNLEEARSSAKKALAIAEENRFTTEIESANARLSQMAHT